MNIDVLRPSAAETISLLVAVAISLLVGAWLAVFVVTQLGSEDNSSAKLWFLFALMAPITYGYQQLYVRAVLWFGKLWWVRVELDNLRGKTLFNAVAGEIEDKADENGHTASTDMEASTNYDRIRGQNSVKMSYWSKRPKTVRLRLCAGDGQWRQLKVHFERGADVICGRDHSVQNREAIVLRLAASGNLLADKKLLLRWLQHCLKLHQEPGKDVVEVMALDQSSTQWVPEWKLRCVRPKKDAASVGQRFFLERESTRPLLADACTWFGKELRCYLITGPAGTGKTELTIWLAGHLKVPLYRLSLNDPRLTDQLFAQLVSPTGMQHDNAVLQIDEFQETLQRWLSVPTQKEGISMGGFCEVLQGSNSLARGFIVLSGTQQLARMMLDREFAAVFRRIAVTTTLNWLSPEDLRTFFCSFVSDFVPGMAPWELGGWAQRFITDEGSPWGGIGISIDMAKQFLMQRISCFRAEFLKETVTCPGIPCTVPVERRGEFEKSLLDWESARTFLKAYPPVTEEKERQDAVHTGPTNK